MKKLAQLQQARAAKFDAQKVLMEERKSSESGVFTDEQRNQFESLTAEIRALDAQIEEEVMVVESARSIAALAGASFNVNGDSEERKIKAAASVSKALRMVTAGQALDGAEKEMNELAVEESRAAGVPISDSSVLNIPISMLRATGQTVSEDGGLYGGQLVQDNAPRVQAKFTAQTILEKLGVTPLSGLTGGAVPLPVFGDYSMAFMGETDTIVSQKTQVNGPKLDPKRLAGAVQLSKRLIMQSSVSAEFLVRSQLFRAYDNALTGAFINGPGTGSSPFGILNLAGVQQSKVVAPAAATKAMLTELVALVAAANAGEGKFLLSPQLREILQNTKADAGSGIFLMDKMNELLGFEAIVSTHVPVLSGNQVLIYGNFAEAYLGEWGSISIEADSLPKANSLELIVNAHADIAVAQPTAFAVNKFMTA
jgi:HK97 family phage major capsid protein